MAYAEFGDPAGRPLILIHGYTDSARSWTTLVPHLAGSRRMILVDLRGHGGSDRPASGYTLSQMAGDLWLAMAALGLARADLVGHSMGGMVVQRFVAEFPEAVDRIVLISTAPLGSGAGLEIAPEIDRLADPIDPDSSFMRAWFGSPTPVDPGFLAALRRDAAAMPAAIWRAVLGESRLGAGLPPPGDWPYRTLLISGALDPIFGPMVQSQLRHRLPRARVVAYPLYGHNPFWEDPQAVASAIEAFLGDG